MSLVDIVSREPGSVADLSQDIQSLSRRVRYLVNAIDQATEAIPGGSEETREALDTVLQFCEIARAELLRITALGEQIEKTTILTKAVA